MKKGIFYNSPKSSCSIHESGLMCYNALALSNNYKLSYTEQQNPIEGNFDFIVFNHHPWTNSWMVPIIHYFKEKTFAIVTEVGDYSNIIPYTPYIFDGYIVLDPTIEDFENIYGFSRPLESLYVQPHLPERITIGSFGFATVGKNWDKIVSKTQMEFDDAIIRFNIPHATFVSHNEYRINSIKEECQKIIYKPNIELQVTSHYFSKQELVQWCAQNTLNAFMYERNQSGLSATTDQAILAERPLYVSDNETFRHIHQYINPLPKTFKEAIETTLPAVQSMKRDWSPHMFAKKFERIIQEEI